MPRKAKPKKFGPGHKRFEEMREGLERLVEDLRNINKAIGDGEDPLVHENYPRLFEALKKIVNDKDFQEFERHPEGKKIVEKLFKEFMKYREKNKKALKKRYSGLAE